MGYHSHNDPHRSLDERSHREPAPAPEQVHIGEKQHEVLSMPPWHCLTHAQVLQALAWQLTGGADSEVQQIQQTKLQQRQISARIRL